MLKKRIINYWKADLDFPPIIVLMYFERLVTIISQLTLTKFWVAHELCKVYIRKEGGTVRIWDFYSMKNNATQLCGMKMIWNKEFCFKSQ